MIFKFKPSGLPALLIIFFCCYFLLTTIHTSGFAQYREPSFLIHDRGILWETVKDNGQIGGMFSDFQYYPSLDWPGGPAVLPSKDEQRSYMQGAGCWIGGKKTDGSVFFNEMGPFTYVGQGTFYEMTEAENFNGSVDFNPNEAEEKITAHWKIENSGLEIKRTSRAWSYPAYADFIIFEYVCTNSSSNNYTDVYLGLPYLIRPSYQDIIVQGYWGDNPNVTDEIVGYDAELNLLYAYDSWPADYVVSLGNYYAEWQELRTTGYAGFAPLYADPARDGFPQPATIFYAQTINNSQLLTLASRSESAMYALLSGADKSLQATEGEKLSPLMLQGFGPYDLASGESVRIVIVEAVNGIPQDQVINITEDELTAAQARLPAGLDSLKNTINRAKVLFENDYIPAALPPPAPEIEFFVLPSTQEIAITWGPELEDWINPQSGKANLEIFRVLRSERSFIGPYKKMKDIKVARTSHRRTYFNKDNSGKWKYTDNTVKVGVGYFYAVTAIDSNDQESGRTNRNITALVTATEPAKDALKVSVFPNPFRLVSGLPTAGEENSIVFTNLPAACTIRIFTVSGDLVRTLKHENPNSGEEVWDQLTDSRQKTAAGIYIYTVESEVGSAKGTLVLIK